MSVDQGVEISLVLPVYNEERIIRTAVEACYNALQNIGMSHEIIVVNDCSTDSTGEIACELANEYDEVRVLQNPINLSVGLSLLIGMRAAKGNIITHNSADLPFDPSELAKVLSSLENADLAVIVRTGRDAHSPWRKIISIVHNALVRILFLVSSRDMNFVQAYRREVIRSVNVRATSPAFVTPELIIRAIKAGYRMVEVKAVFHPRKVGKGNFGNARDILWTIADMISLWIEILRRHRP